MAMSSLVYLSRLTNLLARHRVGEVNDSSEVAVLNKVGFVNLGELVAHEVLIEFCLVVDEVGDHLDIAVRVCPERETGFDRIFLTCERHCEVHRL